MKIGPGVSELWGRMSMSMSIGTLSHSASNALENSLLLSTWPMAYITACTTVQAVIRWLPTKHSCFLLSTYI